MIGTPVNAGSIGTFLMIVAFCCLQPTAGRADSLSLSVQNSETLGGTLIVNCSSSSTPTAWCPPLITALVGSTQATGSLSAGTVGALAQISSALPNVLGFINSWQASAAAQLNYVNTVSASSGTVVFTITVSGTEYSTGTGGIAVAAILIPTIESFAGLSGATLYLPGGMSTVKIVTPVSNGNSYFSFTLAEMATCPGFTLSQMASGDSCTAIADFLDPATITAASVYDANGNLIPDATIVSQSGYSPPLSTPELSSLLLAGTGPLGLLGLAGMVRRWRRLNLHI
ncbi:MAG: hypothetical protein ACRD11_15875 [Terriglobia bacterium]